MSEEKIDLIELHNKLAGEIVTAIVKPVYEAGGKPSDMMLLLESVVIGVYLAAELMGEEQACLDLMFKRAGERLAQIRLLEDETVGHA